MKRIILIGAMLFTTDTTIAGGHEENNSLLSKAECKELKEDIGEALGVADYFWKQIKKATENGKDADKEYAAAGFYSQQAANYTIIYDVWCN